MHETLSHPRASQEAVSLSQAAQPLFQAALSRRALVGALALAPLCSAGAKASTDTLSSLHAHIAQFPAGDLVVVTHQRMLYLVLDTRRLLEYPVAVGKPGQQWFGTRQIDGKHMRPAWSPPEDVRRDNPRLPDVIAGGAAHNPMGAAALTLSPGEYAIHGTSAAMRASIGRYASYGCIRMYDEHILDLLPRVRVGAGVHVIA